MIKGKKKEKRNEHVCLDEIACHDALTSMETNRTSDDYYGLHDGRTGCYVQPSCVMITH